MRHSLPYALFLSLRRIASSQPIYQADEFQQVRYAEQRLLLAQDDLRIRSDYVRPLRRNGTNCLFVDLQQQSHPMTVVSLAHAN